MPGGKNKYKGQKTCQEICHKKCCRMPRMSVIFFLGQMFASEHLHVWSNVKIESCWGWRSKQVFFLYHLLWKPFTVSDLIFGPESKPHAVALLGTICFLVSLFFWSGWMIALFSCMAKSVCCCRLALSPGYLQAFLCASPPAAWRVVYCNVAEDMGHHQRRNLGSRSCCLQFFEGLHPWWLVQWRCARCTRKAEQICSWASSLAMETCGCCCSTVHWFLLEQFWMGSLVLARVHFPRWWHHRIFLGSSSWSSLGFHAEATGLASRLHQGHTCWRSNCDDPHWHRPDLEILLWGHLSPKQVDRGGPDSSSWSGESGRFQPEKDASRRDGSLHAGQNQSWGPRMDWQGEGVHEKATSSKDHRWLSWWIHFVRDASGRAAGLQRSRWGSSDQTEGRMDIGGPEVQTTARKKERKT